MLLTVGWVESDDVKVGRVVAGTGESETDVLPSSEQVGEAGGVKDCVVSTCVTEMAINVVASKTVFISGFRK